MTRVIGVIPAAGHATRLPDLASSKEMVEVADRPVIDHTIERMRVAGPDEIRVVTRPAKKDLIAHALELDCRVVLAETPHVSASLLAGLPDDPDDTPVLFGFPDTVWEPPTGFSQLLEGLASPVDVVLGLFIGLEPGRSDVVELDAGGRVVSIAVKPERPSSDLIWGCAVATAGALRSSDNSEPGVTFALLARSGRVSGVYLSDRFLDVGTQDALQRCRGLTYEELIASLRR